MHNVNHIIPFYCHLPVSCHDLFFNTNTTTENYRKETLGRPRLRWEVNIKMDLEELAINAGNLVDSAQDRDYWRALVNPALNLRDP